MEYYYEPLLVKEDSYDMELEEVEWKWSWRDEYLKWICGYANTNGGILNIGVNDDGYVVGVEDPDQMQETLPDKITSRLGVLVNINVVTTYLGNNVKYGYPVPSEISNKLINQYACGKICSKDISKNDSRYYALEKLERECPIFSENGVVRYVQIHVLRYPFAISCDGKYYKRSGSTLRELNGFELHRFLLIRAGMTWDAAPLPNVYVSDLSKDAIQVFRTKAIGKRRMTNQQAEVSDEILLRDLKLITDGKLTRAAILLFHPDPEQYVTGGFIKIAYFAPAGARGQNKVDDIIYGDDIHGPLITQVDHAMELIYTKYLKAMFSYDGLKRRETYLWPEEAFREVLLNAVIHKTYETGIPIQIRIYDDKITIWNDGKWPKTIDVNRVFERHPSIPMNPKIANAFYRSGEVESWGSGFDKIMQECKKENAPYPLINAHPAGGVEVVCNACDLYVDLEKYGRYYETYSSDDDGQMQQTMMLSVQQQKSIDRMMDILSCKLTDREKEKLWPIVEYLQGHSHIDKQIVMELTGKSSTTAKRYIKILIDFDIICREGDPTVKGFCRK